MDKSMDIHGYPWTYASTKTMDMDLGGLIHLEKMDKSPHGLIHDPMDLDRANLYKYEWIDLS